MIITINIKQPNTIYDWALVKQGEVLNVIVADSNFINNSGIAAQYDFIVNMAGFPGVPVSGGWFYDPIQNTFSAPVVDPVAILVNDFTNIYSVMSGYVGDGQNATSQQIIAAMQQFKQQNTLSPSTSSLFDAIQTYFIAGGN